MLEFQGIAWYWWVLMFLWCLLSWVVSRSWKSESKDKRNSNDDLI